MLLKEHGRFYPLAEIHLTPLNKVVELRKQIKKVNPLELGDFQIEKEMFLLMHVLWIIMEIVAL